jgi:hypothetical protein
MNKMDDGEFPNRAYIDWPREKIRRNTTTTTIIYIKISKYPALYYYGQGKQYKKDNIAERSTFTIKNSLLVLICIFILWR